MDDIYASAIASFQVYGKTWGLPVVSQPGFTFYNQNVLEPLGLGDPWDLYNKGEFTSAWYDEYLAAARQGEGADAVYGGIEFTAVLKLQYLALWGHDAPVWNENMTESALHSDNAAEAWNWLANHVTNGLVPTRSEQSSFVGGSAGLFNSNKLGMMLHARQNNQKFAEATRRAFAAASYDPIEPAIAPVYKWPNGDEYFRDGGNGYGVLQASKFPEETYELLVHLTDGVGRGHMGLGLSIPTKRSLADAEEFIGSFHPWEKDRAEVFDIIQTDATPAFVQPPRYTEIQTLARAAYDEIVLGGLSPQDAMGAIKPQVDEILQEAPPGLKRAFPGDMK
jgi:ABC-type glycerol-3-phosphate transport system substrate-binding protein